MDTHKNNSRSDAPCCCPPTGQKASHDLDATDCKEIPQPDAPWIMGSLKTTVGDVPIVDTTMQISDTIGAWKARWGIRRMTYRVEPRLYAVGRPDPRSPVFVTANYKMSFDRLRAQLGGIDSWIVVLDTKGINVWCAAGKGTFGTDEIIQRVKTIRLGEVVSHRRLILPQLGAPGVRAHEVKEHSGFRVIYGPVQAPDIPAFMAAGRKATPEMRQVRFTFWDRVVLIPVDLVGSAKYVLLAAACLLLLSGLGSGLYSLDRVATYGVVNAILIISTCIAGAALPAMLLPWLPGRAFSIKGAFVGAVLALGVGWYAMYHPDVFPNWPSVAAWLCIIPAIVSFMAMNFTGSSTYTSLSGVKKEMSVAIPLQIAFAVVGLGLWVIGPFV